MRFVSFKQGRRTGLAVRHGGDLIDLAVAAPDLPQELGALIAAGPGALRRAGAAARRAKGDAALKGRFTYLPPIQDPPKIICIGLNYRDHAREANLEIPTWPVLFARWATTLVGHKQPMIRPKLSGKFDYEAEMVVVIGRRGRHIPKTKALDHVAGYSIFNEGSVRDWQFKTVQWTPGKNFDGTGGFGPEMVTPDELPKGGKGLRIQTRLDGRVLQDSNTSEMIFDTATLISQISAVVTLEPGDIIVSGTPHGIGGARKPPVWMKPGQTCEIEIEGIGVLSNPIKAEGK